MDDAPLSDAHPLLQRSVALLERRLIAGGASADEIDLYVALQLELAEGDGLDLVVDPRD